MDSLSKDLLNYIGGFEIANDDGTDPFTIADVLVDETSGEKMHEVIVSGVKDILKKHIEKRPQKEVIRVVPVSVVDYQIPIDQLSIHNGEIEDAVMYCITLDPPCWPESWPKKYRHKVDEKRLSGRLEIAMWLLSHEADRLKKLNR